MRDTGNVLLKKLLLPLLGTGFILYLWWAVNNQYGELQVSFTTLEGKQFSLSEYKGQVVLVSFWATSCPGCVTQMPKLAEKYRQYQNKGLEIVAIAMAYDPPSHVVHYVKKYRLPFPVVLDSDGKLARAFGDVQITPSAYIIDRQGNVAQRITGEVDFTSLHAFLDEPLTSKVL